jgi:limonene 1,2-monooxygenase
VNMETDWFVLRDARLQLRPYTHPCFEIGVAAQISPAGPRAAGRFGAALLSLGATSAGGFDVLGAHWQTCEERAAQYGQTVDRRRWRLVGPMHIRETEEQARADVEHGLADWVRYFQDVAALPIAPQSDDHTTLLDAMNATGISVIGTPEMAVQQIQRLIDQSGGFGTYLFMAHEWADRAATLHSYELFARYVAPLFRGQASRPVASRDWAIANREQFIGGAVAAVMKAVQDHNADKQEAASPPADPVAG